MRITISREKLQESLGAVVSSVPTKSTLPVLANVLLETTDRGLRISATDLDIAVTVEAPADIDVGGAITVPARKLHEIARELPAAPVRLHTVGEQRLNVECGQSKFRLLGLPKDEFPAFPPVVFGNRAAVQSADLHRLISHTAFAVSVEESRPILNGVLWEFGQSVQRMVATNGHRLAKFELPFPHSTGATEQFIIPPKALEQVRKLFPEGEEVQLGHAENHLGFQSPVASVLTRLIEGPYPNYDQVIPRDNDRYAIVNRASLTSALRRMAIVASDQTHRVRLSFNAAILRFSVQTPDLGEAQDEMAVDYNGDPLEIGFNGMYLLETLRYMPTDDVRITFKNAERAATIEPANWSDPAKYLCLVMPLRLVD
ncbi:MAG TPA: DNA polymerase III subunit beta [Gemmatimonadaceae bacterium]|nr:DNA polymerase III subunit beta [Gemmatimonadaceae bacterium]